MFNEKFIHIFPELSQNEVKITCLAFIYVEKFK